MGPESAGADPGPACYGAGGPLTLTDVNLLLGRLDPRRFDIPIHTRRAEQVFIALLEAVGAGLDGPAATATAGSRSGNSAREALVGDGNERERLLEGLRDIANERMADAIRRVSLRKGYDVRDYALVAFGGAGGQHACAVAAHLGIDTILIPEDPGLVSAVGLGQAAIERFAERQILQALHAGALELPAWIRELSHAAIASLEREGVSRERAAIRRVIVTLRLAGQDFSLQVDCDPGVTALDPQGVMGVLAPAFEEKYRSVFGYWQEGRGIEIESIRVVASSGSESVREAATLPAMERAVPAPNPDSPPPDSQSVRSWFHGSWRWVPARERRELVAGETVEGPALVFERYSVTVVEPGWTAEVDGAGALLLRRQRENGAKSGTAAPGASAHQTPDDKLGQVEPMGHESLEAHRDRPRRDAVHPEIVRLELFTHRFETVVKQMGEMLRRTALSTNVKERLDFSCALLDAEGELVVHAPHIPVHLGAMGMCVRRVREALPMDPGDVVVTNHPAYGGSHLPDVTVITPVHLAGGRLLGYVASRAHHAEIGGIRPGSLPAAATRLVEEGVVIPPMHLFQHGEARWETMRRVLSTASFPSRAVEENLADLRAAVAANRNGAEAMAGLASAHGADTIRHYMTELKVRAEARIRAAFGRIPDGVHVATESLDDGSPLRVALTIKSDHAHFDFAGSAGVHPGNLNATPAVVSSVVLYFLRLLVDEPLPLNEGLLHAVTLNVPPGILNPPFPDDPALAPAVVGGNVETSQRLVDTLLKALALAACSQGTMNNVVFGTERYSYYETVCGGAGAGPGFAGASAVHTHMTNTRITDPEVLEHRYPVRVERFAIRRGSGGAGQCPGGYGTIREITFLEPMSLSVLGQHRRTGPYGLAGGEPGKPAVQRLVRASGETVELASADSCEVGPGDRFVLETPGGGGYGPKAAEERR